jgi:FtsZ-binding cell division protein ZapB
LKQRAEQYDTLRLEYDVQDNYFHRLNMRYKEQIEVATMFQRDLEIEQAKFRNLEDKLKAERMKTPTCYNKMNVAGGYQPIEIENLQEEVRQLVFINDDLSTKLEEEASRNDKLKVKLWEWKAK